MKKHRIFKPMILGLAFLIFCYFFYDSVKIYRSTRDKNEYDHMCCAIISSFSNIAISIMIYAQDAADKPPQTIKALIKWLISRDNMILTIIDDIGIIKIDHKTYQVLDPWGNEIVLIVVSPHNYILKSYGRNKIDDNGQGDDIIYSFDPLKYISK